ncbi:MAG: hypothetical protein M1819_007024 [Sarea resinae]|nr:MAG: hypothetical protein M1819_007024 [Sarea resinae]
MGEKHAREAELPAAPSRLFERLSSIPGYVWDESIQPFHSSYDNWHVFGKRRISHDESSSLSSASSVTSDGRASPVAYSRPNLAQHSSSATIQPNHFFPEQSQAAEPYQQVVARISSHVLRLEREFHLCKTLIQTSDPDCHHIVRPIELARLPPQQGDPGPMVVFIVESPGENYITELVNLGPMLCRTPPREELLEEKMNFRDSSTAMALPPFLDFAIGASQCLELLHHGQRIVHGELRGDAFHFNQDTGHVRLINFGSGPRSFENGLTSAGWSSLSREIGVRNKLQYIAPEQTGRLPAEPDSRTDIYSLGVLFWVMLTRTTPFEGQSPMDVMQNVLSRRIPPVSSIRVDVPEVLSSIIQKMTQKQIDLRYHSVSGLKYDLMSLQKILGEGDNEALQHFEIGTRDVSSFFKLPSAMFGRTDEQKKLLDVIKKVSSSPRRKGAIKKSPFSVSASSSISDGRLEGFEVGDASSEASSAGSRHNSGTSVPLLSSNPSPSASQEEVETVGDRSQSEPRPQPETKPSMDSKLSHFSKNSYETKSLSDSIDASRTSSGPSGGSHHDVGGPRNRRLRGHKLVRKGQCEVVAVAGSAGLGKSCLVQSIHADVRSYGYFSLAKFDQAKRTPYEPVLKCMGSLFRQIFSESDVSTNFHDAIRTSVKPIWSVLHTMLDLPIWLLGSQNIGKPASSSGSMHLANRTIQAEFPQRDSSSTMSPNSSFSLNIGQSTADFLRGGNNIKTMRLKNIFLDVLRLLAAHKFICLSLEDLQFADEESLELISDIVASQIQLVLVVTYRKEDILPEKVREIIESQKASVTTIELAPLKIDDVVELVVATLQRTRDYVSPLANFLYEKSKGNPFILREMLNTCHRKNILWYSWQHSQWEYDIDRVFSEFAEGQGQQLSGSFVADRLKELPRAGRWFLAWASLIGHSFSFGLVQKLMSGEFDYDKHRKISPMRKNRHAGSPTKDALAGLQAALHAYIIMQEDGEDQFRFSHDRYIQAAASLRESDDLPKMHFIIAQTMMKYHDLDDRSLYDRAQHICQAKDLFRKRVNSRRPFRALLCEAAEKASESAAKATALYYCRHSLELLQPDPWNDSLPDVDYDETLDLYTGTAELYGHQGCYNEATELLQTIFRKARSPEDKAPAWILQGRVLNQKGDSVGALSALKKCMEDLGEYIEPATWEDCDMQFSQLCVQLQSMGRSVFVEAISATYWCEPLLFYQLTLRMIHIHLRRGRFKMIEFGCAMGDLSEELLLTAQLDSDTIAGQRTAHSLFVAHLDSHIQNQLSVLEAAMEACIPVGDRNLTLLNLGTVAISKLWCSDDVVDLEAFCTYAPEEIRNWEKDLRGGVLLCSVRQVARALQGKTDYSCADRVLSNEEHSSEDYLSYIRSQASDPERPLQIYQGFALLPLYLFGHFEKAIEVGNALLATLDHLWSARLYRSILFYYSLSLLAHLRDDPSPHNRAETLEKATACKRQIEVWETVNDINYAMWSLLLSAEIYELTGDYGAAIQSYESALDHAEVHSFTLEQAMAFELLGEFFLRRGSKRAGLGSLREAMAAYMRMGAVGKSDHVAAKHEWLLKISTSSTKVDVGCQTQAPENTSYRLEENEQQANRLLGDETKEDRTQAWLTPKALNDEGKDVASGLSGLGLDMIDLTSILESSQVISSELQVDRLLAKMTDIVLDSTGGLSDVASILIEDEDIGWSIAVIGDPENGVQSFPAGRTLDDLEGKVSRQVILYALRFKETVFLHNLLEDERFSNVSQSYLARNPNGKSIIALPIIHTDSLLGLLYLEGQPNAFTERNLTVLRLLVNQIGISLANALLFKRVEKVSASNASMIESQKRALAQARDAEQKAKLAEAEAMRNVRLKEEAAKAKSMFLANVSHELRTPLNGVIGMSELLKGTDLNMEQAGYADSIRVCADTLLTVINDILDFSKLEAGKMAVMNIPLSLDETIKEVVRALSYANLERGLKTYEKLDLDPELLVMGDPVRLHQIFMNLLSNAYKFTPKGSVTIRATTDYETADSITVTCSIADTGIGITQEQLTRLFLPFSQADSSTARSYGGSGLGLSICKAIIENVLGGKIWLLSESGKGTTVSFTITFPKAPKDSTTGQEGPPRDPDPMSIYSPPAEEKTSPILQAPLIDLRGIPRDQLRICIAEDNPINQKIAISFVKKLGFKCDAYSDGQQAVEALRKRAAEGPDHAYHLVLMDVQMPTLDGYEATKLIRKDENPAVRRVLVIAMTASAIRGDREKCIESGMNNYLAKPVRAQVLKDMIESYLRQDRKHIPNIQEAANDLAKSVVKDVDHETDQRLVGDTADSPGTENESSSTGANDPRSALTGERMRLSKDLPGRPRDKNRKEPLG